MPASVSSAVRVVSFVISQLTQEWTKFVGASPLTYKDFDIPRPYCG